jgi:hypothetical protein
MAWFTIQDRSTRKLMTDGGAFNALDAGAGVLIWPSMEQAARYAADTVRAMKTLGVDDLPQP